MKIVKILITTIFVIVFSFINHFSIIEASSGLESRNRIVVFVVDTSLSMKEKGSLPMKRVKSFMKENVEKSDIGDRIVIITFDEDVRLAHAQEIISYKDIKNINGHVDKIRPVGKWTWIRNALNELKERVTELRNKYPEKKLVAYFLTDGKDDPPPKSNERRRSLAELLLRYFRDLEEEDTYIYVLYSNPESVTTEEEREINKRTQVKVKQISESEAGPIYRFIEIEPDGINLGNIVKGDSTLKGEITIKRLINAEKKVVRMKLLFDGYSQTLEGPLLAVLPFSHDVRVSPDSFIADEEGQRIPLIFQAPLNLRTGHYRGSLNMESSIDIIPSKIKIEFKVMEKLTKKVYLGPSKFVLGKTKLGQGMKVKRFLKIKKLYNAQGEKVKLTSTLPGVEIIPSEIYLDQEGRKEIKIKISQDLSPGKRFAEFEITSDEPEMVIFPSKIGVSFFVKDLKAKKKGSAGERAEGLSERLSEKLQKVIFLFAMLLFLWVLWSAFLRNKTLWVGRSDNKKVNNIIVKGWTKSSLEGIGLSTYYLGFQKLWWGIILRSKNEEVTRKVNYQSEFPCQLHDGKLVNIFFNDTKLTLTSDDSNNQIF